MNKLEKELKSVNGGVASSTDENYTICPKCGENAMQEVSEGLLRCNKCGYEVKTDTNKSSMGISAKAALPPHW